MFVNITTRHRKAGLKKEGTPFRPRQHVSTKQYDNPEQLSLGVLLASSMPVETSGMR